MPLRNIALAHAASAERLPCANAGAAADDHAELMHPAAAGKVGRLTAGR